MNRGLFAYQPNALALALGQAGSQMQLYQFYEIYLGGPVFVFVKIYRVIQFIEIIHLKPVQEEAFSHLLSE